MTCSHDVLEFEDSRILPLNNLISAAAGSLRSSVRGLRASHRAVLAAFTLGLAALCAAVAAPAPSVISSNVFLITADGLRWQELFSGAEELLLNKENGGVGDTNALRAAFWRPTPDERRRVLMPFFWNVIASNGQLLGNPSLGSTARVTNGRNFSYPGYSELLTGVADPAIDSNDKRPNPHTNVVEWLHAMPQFTGRAAAYCSWEVFPWILNRDRSGLKVFGGWELVDQPSGPREPIHEVLRDTTRVWSSVIYDAFTYHAAVADIRARKPRVFYLALGETDDWAHEGRYDLYLHAARAFDRFVERLWTLVQEIPEYRGTTTFLLTTDHGRGSGPVAWKNHGQAIAESAFIWVAALGPSVTPRGERRDTSQITQSQIAATTAALLGHDFPRAHPAAAPPIQELWSQP